MYRPQTPTAAGQGPPQARQVPALSPIALSRPATRSPAPKGQGSGERSPEESWRTALPDAVEIPAGGIALGDDGRVLRPNSDSFPMKKAQVSGGVDQAGCRNGLGELSGKFTTSGKARSARCRSTVYTLQHQWRRYARIYTPPIVVLFQRDACATFPLTRGKARGTSPRAVFAPRPYRAPERAVRSVRGVRHSGHHPPPAAARRRACGWPQGCRARRAGCGS